MYFIDYIDIYIEMNIYNVLKTLRCFELLKKNKYKIQTDQTKANKKLIMIYIACKMIIKFLDKLLQQTHSKAFV